MVTQRNLIQAYRPLSIVNYVVGYRAVRKLWGCKLYFLYYLVIVSALFYNFYVIMWDLYPLEALQTTNSTDKLWWIIHALKRYLYNLFICVSIITGRRKTEDFCKLLGAIDKIDNTLRSLGASVPTNREIFIQSIIMLIISILCFLAMFVTSVIDYYNEENINYQLLALDLLDRYIGFVNAILILIIPLNFVHCVRSVRKRYEQLNNLLYDEILYTRATMNVDGSVSQSMRTAVALLFPFCKTNVYHLIGHRMEVMSQLYLALYRCIKKINTLFNIQIILCAVWLQFHFLLSLHKAVFKIYYKYMGNHLWTIPIVFLFCDQLYLCYICEILKEKVEESITAISSMRKSELNANLQLQVLQFSLQLMNNSENFKIFGFLPLSYAFIISSCSWIVSCIFSLTQF